MAIRLFIANVSRWLLDLLRGESSRGQKGLFPPATSLFSFSFAEPENGNSASTVSERDRDSELGRKHQPQCFPESRRDQMWVETPAPGVFQSPVGTKYG